MNTTLGAVNLTVDFVNEPKAELKEVPGNIRVIVWQRYFHLKHTAFVNASFGARNNAPPYLEIVRRFEYDATKVFFPQVNQLALDTLHRHLHTYRSVAEEIMKAQLTGERPGGMSEYTNYVFQDELTFVICPACC